MSSQNYYIPHDPSFRTLMTCARKKIDDCLWKPKHGTDGLSVDRRRMSCASVSEFLSADRDRGRESINPWAVPLNRANEITLESSGSEFRVMN